MDARRLKSGLCWFGATCLAAASLILVLAGITATVGAERSLAGIGLIVLAAIALVLMVVLMALAFRFERRRDVDA